MEYSSSKKARLPGISFDFGGGSDDSEEDDYYSEDGSLHGHEGAERAGHGPLTNGGDDDGDGGASLTIAGTTQQQQWQQGGEGSSRCATARPHHPVRTALRFSLSPTALLQTKASLQKNHQPHFFPAANSISNSNNSNP